MIQHINSCQYCHCNVVYHHNMLSKTIKDSGILQKTPVSTIYVHPQAPCPTAQLNPPSAAKGAFQWKGHESTMSYPRSTSAFGWWVFRDKLPMGLVAAVLGWDSWGL